MCPCQQYAMETDRTQCQLCTSNKARNLHHWFSTFYISHPSAAETPVRLRLDYVPDDSRKRAAGSGGRTYVLQTSVLEHGSQNILVVKQPRSCLLHR